MLFPSIPGVLDDLMRNAVLATIDKFLICGHPDSTHRVRGVVRRTDRGNRQTRFIREYTFTRA